MAAHQPGLAAKLALWHWPCLVTAGGPVSLLSLGTCATLHVTWTLFFLSKALANGLFWGKGLGSTTHSQTHSLLPATVSVAQPRTPCHWERDTSHARALECLLILHCRLELSA